MAKLTLTPITSAYQAVAALNANNVLIEAALENTLSRDGTLPNTMSASFDMNSNKIINVAQAVGASDAVNYQQVQDLLAAVGSGGVGGLAASLVSVVDAGAFYTAIDVEGVLQEIGSFTQIVPVSTGASNVLRGDGAGAWVEETALTIDATGNLLTTGNLRTDAFLVVGDGANFMHFTMTGTIFSLDFSGGTVDYFDINRATRLQSLLYLGTNPAAGADIPGFGQMWVAIGGEDLYFTSDSGVTQKLAGGGTIDSDTFRVTTNGSIQTNNAVLVDDVDLVITLQPGDYIVEGYINWGQSGGGGGGIQMRMNVNSGTLNGTGSGALAQASQVITAEGPTEHLVLDIGGSTRIINSTDLDQHRGHYRGVVSVNTTAEIAFQWAQRVSDPAQVSIGAGFLEYTRIDGGF